MTDAGFPLQIGEPTEELYGTCAVCGRTVRWWPAEAWAAARWVHQMTSDELFVNYPNHRAEVADA
jgi:hypothetical protein